LRLREPSFVTEADGARSTMLLPLRSGRGHDLGWIGLSLPGKATPPDPEPIRRRVEELAASL
jgi:hypothetical protein